MSFNILCSCAYFFSLLIIWSEVPPNFISSGIWCEESKRLKWQRKTQQRKLPPLLLNLTSDSDSALYICLYNCKENMYRLSKLMCTFRLKVNMKTTEDRIAVEKYNLNKSLMYTPEKQSLSIPIKTNISLVFSAVRHSWSESALSESVENVNGIVQQINYMSEKKCYTTWSKSSNCWKILHKFFRLKKSNTMHTIPDEIPQIKVILCPTSRTFDIRIPLCTSKHILKTTNTAYSSKCRTNTQKSTLDTNELFRANGCSKLTVNENSPCNLAKMYMGRNTPITLLAFFCRIYSGNILWKKERSLLLDIDMQRCQIIVC